MAAVGDELLLIRTPDREQLVRYAGASGDFNPIHYDDEFARAAGLPGVIAHGMLTMGFAAELAGMFAGPDGRVEAISVRFTGMVRPGDTLTVRGTVAGPEPKGAAEDATPGGASPGSAAEDTVSLDLRVENQRGETVLVGTARVSRRPAATAGGPAEPAARLR